MLALFNRSVRICGLLDDGFECCPFRFHANVAIVLEHPFRDVPGNVHDGLVTSAALGQLRDKRVPVVAPAPSHLGVFAEIVPGCLERGDVTGGIGWPRLSEREDIPLGPNLPKSLGVPSNVLGERREQGRVQRDGTTLATFCLAVPDGQEVLRKIDLCPGQCLDLGIAHPGVQRTGFRHAERDSCGSLHCTERSSRGFVGTSGDEISQVRRFLKGPIDRRLWNVSWLD